MGCRDAWERMHAILITPGKLDYVSNSAPVSARWNHSSFSPSETLRHYRSLLCYGNGIILKLVINIWYIPVVFSTVFNFIYLLQINLSWAIRNLLFRNEIWNFIHNSCTAYCNMILQYTKHLLLHLNSIRQLFTCNKTCWYISYNTFSAMQCMQRSAKRKNCFFLLSLLVVALVYCQFACSNIVHTMVTKSLLTGFMCNTGTATFYRWKIKTQWILK